MASRSRSNSLTSRGECKNCIGKRGKWQGHLCLRHAPCMDNQLHLWVPDKCSSCIKLFDESTSDDSPASNEARLILKEIMRSAEAVASRKDLSGFVSQKVFDLRFQGWMGIFNNPKSVRLDTNLPSTGRENESSRSQNQVPSRCHAPISTPSTSKSSEDLLSVAVSQAQIELTSQVDLSQEIHDSKSQPDSRKSHAKTRCSPSRSHRASVTPSRHHSREESRSPSYESRKRSHRNSSHASPHVSPGELSSKRPKNYHRRERSRSPSPSILYEFHEFRRFKRHQERKRHVHHYRQSFDGRRLAYRERSRSRHRSQRRYYSPSRSPQGRHAESRSSSRSSYNSCYQNGSPSGSPQSGRYHSDEGSPSRLTRTAAASRSPSPVTLVDPSSRTLQLFGSESEDESLPEQPKAHSTNVCPPPLRGTSPSRLASDVPTLGPRDTQVNTDSNSLTSHPQGTEEMCPERTYYYMSPDARLDDTGLSARNLPKLPRCSLHVAKRNNRQVVAFLDPSEYPALEFISRFSRVGAEKDLSQSQRDRLRCLNRIVQAGERHNFGFDWQVQDHDSQDSDFIVNSIEAMEEYADVVSQAKGYGDESKRPPLQPHVPLRSTGPKLQNLVDFL